MIDRTKDARFAKGIDELATRIRESAHPSVREVAVRILTEANLHGQRIFDMAENAMGEPGTSDLAKARIELVMLAAERGVVQFVQLAQRALSMTDDETRKALEADRAIASLFDSVKKTFDFAHASSKVNTGGGQS